MQRNVWSKVTAVIREEVGNVHYASRAKFSRSLVVVYLALAGAGAAAQHGYPSKPIRLIVPLAPGEPSDILGRTMAQKLSESLKQTVVVDNRIGAGGTIGIDIAAKSPPDGDTILLVAGATYTISANLYGKLPYNPHKDLMPISILAGAPHVFTVHPSLPVRNVTQLIAVSGGKRSPRLPDMPTLAEQGVPGFEEVGGHALWLPAETPREIVVRLHQEIVKALHSPEVRARIETEGAEIIGNTPEQAAAVIRADMEKWAEVIRRTGMRAN